MPLQIPPAVGSSGQFVETVIVTSSQNRHVMALGDAVSTAYGPLTSSGGLLVALSNQNAPTTAVNIVGTVPIVSASSGLVQISGTPTVLTASSGYLIRSLSSGIVSPSSNWTVVSTATTITSGTITLSSATSLSSGTVTLSSNPTVVSASSGVIQLSSAPLVIVATSGGQITVTNVSASSGLVQTLTSGPMTIAGTVTVFNTSSGIVQAIVTGSSGVGAIVTSSGALLVSGTPGSVSTAVNLLTTLNIGYPVTTSYGQISALFGSQSSARFIIATSVGKISSAPGVLTYISALSTSIALDGRYLRLYDQTTGNATSANNSGLAGACMLFRIHTSVAATPISDDNTLSFPHGIKFATACSFDLVVAATSTAANALGGWVTAQYTS